MYLKKMNICFLCVSIFDPARFLRNQELYSILGPADVWFLFRDQCDRPFESSHRHDEQQLCCHRGNYKRIYKIVHKILTVLNPL